MKMCGQVHCRHFETRKKNHSMKEYEVVLAPVPFWALWKTIYLPTSEFELSKSSFSHFADSSIYIKSYKYSHK
jgi:hypothetical protein